MKPSKLTNQYDYSYVVSTSLAIKNNDYGFEGVYTHPYGYVYIYLTQDMSKNYHLMLDLIKNGREYHRNFTCDKKPTVRLAGLKAKQFIEEIF